MGRVNTPKLDDKSNLGLEKGMKSGKTHAYRKRCHLVLLKAEKRKSADVGAILKMHENSVNFWLARYKKEGLEGLQNQERSRTKSSS